MGRTLVLHVRRQRSNVESTVGGEGEVMAGVSREPDRFGTGPRSIRQHEGCSDNNTARLGKLLHVKFTVPRHLKRKRSESEYSRGYK